MIYRGKQIAFVAGIDPGLSGALAFFKLTYENKTYDSTCVDVVDMPTIVEANGKRAINCRALAEQFDRFGFVYTFVEKVGAMPGQGVTSMFSFGRGLGMLECALQLKEIPYEYITPQSWKKQVGLIKKPKEASMERAQALIPECPTLLSRKKHAGRADAMLIGLVGTQQILDEISKRDR